MEIGQLLSSFYPFLIETFNPTSYNFMNQDFHNLKTSFMRRICLRLIHGENKSIKHKPNIRSHAKLQSGRAPDSCLHITYLTNAARHVLSASGKHSETRFIGNSSYGLIPASYHDS